MPEILILSEDGSDVLIERVRERLLQGGYSPLVIDTHSLPTQLITLSQQVTSECAINGLDLTRTDLRVWWRRGSWVAPEDIPDAEAAVRSYAARQYNGAIRAIQALTYDNRKNWMNHPLDEARIDENKPLQHALARRSGLRVPDTLCTTDPVAASSFARKHEYLAVKALAGFPLATRDDNGTEVPLGMLTQRLGQARFLELAEMVRYAPLLIQPYIEKRCEYRVTIVGQECHIARIHSQESEMTQVDWRNYDLANTPHEAAQLPQDVVASLHIFMSLAQLEFAAVDLIETPTGEIVFLEANPCGQYGWIEDLTGLAISESIAHWLTKVTS